MLKKFILILIVLIGIPAFANDNYLNSVVIDNADGNTSIVLRSDSVAKIKKSADSSDKMVLSLKGISQSPNISTLYKNSAKVDALTIQNDGNNGLKIYISAPNIAKANVIFDTPNSSPIIMNYGVKKEKLIWSLISVAILLLVMCSSKNASPENNKKDINEILKEREKELYRNFQKEVSSIPTMNYRLKSYSKHVLKGETIRSYESRMATKI